MTRGALREELAFEKLYKEPGAQETMQADAFKQRMQLFNPSTEAGEPEVCPSQHRLQNPWDQPYCRAANRQHTMRKENDEQSGSAVL